MLLLNDDINIMYGNSIKFYVEMIDTLNNLSQVGTGAVNPIIYTHSLENYTLK